jgi:hypothetical protein
MNKNDNLTPQIVKIEFIRRHHILSDIIDSDGYYSAVIKDGIDWEEIYHAPGTAFFEEKPKDTPAGNLMEQSIEFVHPGRSDSSTSLLLDLLACFLICKIHYDDDTKKVIGMHDYPADLVYNFSTKLLGYKVNISCKSQCESAKIA